MLEEQPCSVSDKRKNACICKIHMYRDVIPKDFGSLISIGSCLQGSSYLTKLSSFPLLPVIMWRSSHFGAQLKLITTIINREHPSLPLFISAIVGCFPPSISTKRRRYRSSTRKWQVQLTRNFTCLCSSLYVVQKLWHLKLYFVWSKIWLIAS